MVIFRPVSVAVITPACHAGEHEFKSRTGRMKVHGHRTMLNKPGFGTTAAIVAEVADTSTWKEGCDQYGKPIADSAKWNISPDVNFSISDCSRQITFEGMGDGEPEDWDNLFFKVDSMIDALTTFRAGLVDEQERYRRRREIYDARPNKDKDGFE